MLGLKSNPDSYRHVAAFENLTEASGPLSRDEALRLFGQALEHSADVIERGMRLRVMTEAEYQRVYGGRR